jgi:hypothetical protein
MTSTRSYGVRNACKSTRLPPKIIFTEFQHLATRGCRYIKLRCERLKIIMRIFRSYQYSICWYSIYLQETAPSDERPTARRSRPLRPYPSRELDRSHAVLHTLEYFSLLRARALASCVRACHSTEPISHEAGDAVRAQRAVGGVLLLRFLHAHTQHRTGVRTGRRAHAQGASGGNIEEKIVAW